MDTTTELASKFGVEIETRIKGLEGLDPPDVSEDNNGGTEYEKQMQRWERHVAPLSADLTKNHVANHLTADQYGKDQETYYEWYLTQDDSITQDRLWGVELVSPVFDYPSRDTWKNQLSRVYGVINNAPFFSDPDGTCALHVHTSIEPAWTEARVRRLALAILRYTPQFSQLARKVGRTGKHAVAQAIPNNNSIPTGAPAVRGQHLGRSLETTRDIVEALCPKDTRTLWTSADPRPPRHYFWNLWPLVGLGFDENEGHYFVKRTGTVEFRLPPSPRTDVDAAAWIDFANLFVLAAVSDDDGDGDPPAAAGEDSSLLLFVRGWGERSGVPAEDLGRVEKLLTGL
ncbi:hypothetical protein SLS62_010657 [Diatrype stigma]|uniref:Amidoligase enzyme n=1 Tax=Diatrype stigma TaxID=117547 RepID=A0AAN9U858_9PEZI